VKEDDVLRTVRLLSLFAGVLVILPACSRQGTKTEDFIPPSDKARQALEAALNHWQGGHPPGKVPGTNPPVDVQDFKWKAGQKLKSYEILGEESGPEQRFFRVRLTLAEGAPIEVKYMVLGIDPLLVYREEDYQKLSGMGK
jgi:hypothetical protein